MANDDRKSPISPSRTIDKRNGELPPRPIYYKPPKPVVPPAPKKKD